MIKYTRMAKQRHSAAPTDSLLDSYCRCRVEHASGRSELPSLTVAGGRIATVVSGVALTVPRTICFANSGRFGRTIPCLLAVASDQQLWPCPNPDQTRAETSIPPVRAGRERRLG